MDRLALPKRMQLLNTNECLEDGPLKSMKEALTGGVPSGILPNCAAVPLQAKLPIIRSGPKGSEAQLARTKLSVRIHSNSDMLDFDLNDPYLYSPLTSHYYEPLHDPHLKQHFKQPALRRRLVKNGFITREGRVLCTLKQFNEWRQYIRRIYIAMERRLRDVEAGTRTERMVSSANSMRRVFCVGGQCSYMPANTTNRDASTLKLLANAARRTRQASANKKLVEWWEKRKKTQKQHLDEEENLRQEMEEEMAGRVAERDGRMRLVHKIQEDALAKAKEKRRRERQKEEQAYRKRLQSRLDRRRQKDGYHMRSKSKETTASSVKASSGDCSSIGDYSEGDMGEGDSVRTLDGGRSTGVSPVSAIHGSTSEISQRILASFPELDHGEGDIGCIREESEEEPENVDTTSQMNAEEDDTKPVLINLGDFRGMRFASEFSTLSSHSTEQPQADRIRSESEPALNLKADVCRHIAAIISNANLGMNAQEDDTKPFPINFGDFRGMIRNDSEIIGQPQAHRTRSSLALNEDALNEDVRRHIDVISYITSDVVLPALRRYSSEPAGVRVCEGSFDTCGIPEFESCESVQIDEDLLNLTRPPTRPLTPLPSGRLTPKVMDKSHCGLSSMAIMEEKPSSMALMQERPAAASSDESDEDRETPDRFRQRIDGHDSLTKLRKASLNNVNTDCYNSMTMIGKNAVIPPSVSVDSINMTREVSFTSLDQNSVANDIQLPSPNYEGMVSVSNASVNKLREMSMSMQPNQDRVPTPPLPSNLSGMLNKILTDYKQGHLNSTQVHKLMNVAGEIINSASGYATKTSDSRCPTAIASTVANKIVQNALQRVHKDLFGTQEPGYQQDESLASAVALSDIIVERALSMATKAVLSYADEITKSERSSSVPKLPDIHTPDDDLGTNQSQFYASNSSLRSDVSCSSSYIHGLLGRVISDTPQGFDDGNKTAINKVISGTSIRSSAGMNSKTADCSQADMGRKDLEQAVKSMSSETIESTDTDVFIREALNQAMGGVEFQTTRGKSAANMTSKASNDSRGSVLSDVSRQTLTVNDQHLQPNVSNDSLTSVLSDVVRQTLSVACKEIDQKFGSRINSASSSLAEELVKDALHGVLNDVMNGSMTVEDISSLSSAILTAHENVALSRSHSQASEGKSMTGSVPITRKPSSKTSGLMEQLIQETLSRSQSMIHDVDEIDERMDTDNSSLYSFNSSQAAAALVNSTIDSDIQRIQDVKAQFSCERVNGR